ncbi:MAG: FHA domain-containing protein [Actinomycetota bacterium]|nr:FHA domain-containing protein [Actinomycetota bacterium]
MACNRCGYGGMIKGDICPKCGRDARGTALSGETSYLSPVELESIKMAEEQGGETEGPALIVEKGPTIGMVFPLDKEETSIGRHLGSDIFLDDITVSRKHAQISKKSDGFILRDMGSLNGTYVNEDLVEETFLNGGDEIQIGRFKLVFKA